MSVIEIPGLFFWPDAELILADRQMHASDKLVLGACSAHRREHGGRWPARHALAAMLGVSVPTINVCVRRLRTLGWLHDSPWSAQCRRSWKRAEIWRKRKLYCIRRRTMLANRAGRQNADAALAADGAS